MGESGASSLPPVPPAMHMTANAVVYYTRGGDAPCNRSMNFGSPYAPGESKEKYGITHDGTILGAARAYYDSVELGPYVVAKNIVTYRRSYDVAAQEWLEDGKFSILDEDGDEGARQTLPTACPT